MRILPRQYKAGFSIGPINVTYPIDLREIDSKGCLNPMWPYLMSIVWLRKESPIRLSLCTMIIFQITLSILLFPLGKYYYWQLVPYFNIKLYSCALMYQYYIHKVQSITYFMNINSIIFCDEKEVFWQKWLSLVNTSHCSIINQVPNYKDVMMTTFESMYIIIQNISRQQNNPLLPNFLLNINKSHFLEYDQYMSNRFNSFFQNHTKKRENT